MERWRVHFINKTACGQAKMNTSASGKAIKKTLYGSRLFSWVCYEYMSCYMEVGACWSL